MNLVRGDQIEIQVDNIGSFRVNNFMDIWTLKEVLVDHIYEAVYPLPQKGIVVDIGAGIGDMCILSNQKSNQVYAYDPDPNRAKLCHINLKLNHAENVFFKSKPAKSLDQIFKENKLKIIDFLKIDCEGCEYPILNQSHPSLLGKIKTIAMEVHLFNQCHRRQFFLLKKRLRENGFYHTVKPNQVHRQICYLYARNLKTI